MWLLTPIGFFSIVKKSSDAASGTLTIRARAAEDLDALRDTHLPSLSKTVDKAGSDYPFRATALAAEVAEAIAQLTREIQYSNFKDEVKQQQGYARASIYSKVWRELLAVSGLKSSMKPKGASATTTASTGVQVAALHVEPKPAPGPSTHPRPDDKGQAVKLKSPSTPTQISAWADAGALARVTPGGVIPPRLNGVSFTTWTASPATASAWEQLAKQTEIAEPAFNLPAGKKAAAGAVIREPDGRYWVVSPSNAFGGYTATFPKGTLEGLSLQAAALKEVFEESGLRVRLTSWLMDTPRTRSFTRYYLAERVDGNPADMGWESQAVSLVPVSKLSEELTNASDKPLLQHLLITP